MDNVLLVGIGHRARQGKDWLCEELAKMLSFSDYTHWAKALYAECMSGTQQHPLIMESADGKVFSLLHQIKNGTATYRIFKKGEFPEVESFMRNHGKTYQAMKEKDAVLLQLWGTNYRRQCYGDRYWVNKTIEEVKNDAEQKGDHAPKVIFIPDTRFFNEYETIKNLGGLYIDVQRFNEDGTRYYAPDRDRNHQSEAELDALTDDQIDYVAQATSGDLDKLREHARNIVELINSRLQIKSAA